MARQNSAVQNCRADRRSPFLKMLGVPRTCLEHRRTGVASGVQRSEHNPSKTASYQGKRWSASDRPDPAG